MIRKWQRRHGNHIDPQRIVELIGKQKAEVFRLRNEALPPNRWGETSWDLVEMGERGSTSARGSAEWGRPSRLAFASSWAGPVSGRCEGEAEGAPAITSQKRCILPDTELLMLLQHFSNNPGPTRCSSKLSSTEPKSKRGLSTQASVGARTTKRSGSASGRTREVAPFAVAAERNAPDTTPEEKGGSSLSRCGVSRYFFGSAPHPRVRLNGSHTR